MSAAGVFTLETRLGNWESQFPDHSEDIASQGAQGISKSGRFILLVDDDYGVRLLARDVLEAQGFQVLEACNSAEALKIWREKGPQIELLLTDFAMPGIMNGRKLAESLLAEQPNLKIVMMSGHGSKVVADSILGRHFLQKPFSLHSLASIVHKCLGRE